MYKLYNIRRWGSMAPHLLLEEMGVPYQNVWLTPEQVRAPEFRDIHPLGLLPALGLADGRSMIESGAITAFLAAAHPDKGMAPAPGSADQGVFLSLLHFMSTNIYPAINLAEGSGGAGGYALDAAHATHIAAVATAKQHELFGVLDARLAADGPFLMGETFSALDLYLFMLTIWAKPGEAEVLARFPHIAGLVKTVRARPKLKAALEAHGVMDIAAAAV